MKIQKRKRNQLGDSEGQWRKPTHESVVGQQSLTQSVNHLFVSMSETGGLQAIAQVGLQLTIPHPPRRWDCGRPTMPSCQSPVKPPNSMAFLSNGSNPESTYLQAFSMDKHLGQGFAPHVDIFNLFWCYVLALG